MVIQHVLVLVAILLLVGSQLLQRNFPQSNRHQGALFQSTKISKINFFSKKNLLLIFQDSSTLLEIYLSRETHLNESVASFIIQRIGSDISEADCPGSNCKTPNSPSEIDNAQITVLILMLNKIKHKSRLVYSMNHIKKLI